MNLIAFQYGMSLENRTTSRDFMLKNLSLDGIGFKRK